MLIETSLKPIKSPEGSGKPHKGSEPTHFQFYGLKPSPVRSLPSPFQKKLPLTDVGKIPAAPCSSRKQGLSLSIPRHPFSGNFFSSIHNFPCVQSCYWMRQGQLHSIPKQAVLTPILSTPVSRSISLVIFPLPHELCLTSCFPLAPRSWNPAVRPNEQNKVQVRKASPSPEGQKASFSALRLSPRLWSFLF